MSIPNVNTVDIPTKTYTRPILSPREFQVFYMIASGIPVKEVANELNLSIATIHTYRGRIKDKLRLESNVQMTLYAIKKGIIKPENITFN